jgi:hypothetical protein
MKQTIETSSSLWKRISALSLAAATLFIAEGPSSGQSMDQAGRKFLGIPLSGSAKVSHRRPLEREGVPFIIGSLSYDGNGVAKIDVGGTVKRIFLLGMAENATIRCWADPTNHSVRFYIGDDLGRIQLNYADGTTEIYPLVLGENVWFGQTFKQYPEPYSTDARFRKALANSLKLYPPAPVGDGNYLAVITPRPAPIQSIAIESSPDKQGTLILNGMTVEPAGAGEIAGAVPLDGGDFSEGFAKFIQKKSLRLSGKDEKQIQRALEAFRMALYSSDKVFSGSDVDPEVPQDYSGPQVSFDGSIYARILANAFAFNVQDISDKIDEQGMYHTSTKGAISWNGNAYGTFRTNAGTYYATSWSRDMGRSLQELTILGYTNDALRCADYCLRMAKLWENPALKYKGQTLLPHWSRVANRPQNSPPFENDGHGMVSLFLYKLWQRLPDRDDWLRARWPDIKDAGDWVVWQLDHPEISRATNGVLHTTGECAGGNGYSVYGDYSCMVALRALAQMADSIGQADSANKWCQYADKMKVAMGNQYIIDDAKYGRVWTLADAGWPTHPTVLGPLIFRADYQGFAPEDEDDDWHPVNQAAYERLIDTYQPFGFYGQAMGYGQGFVTESALLLDRMHDATTMLDWVAKQIYDPRYGSFITPEGVQVDPTGKYWFRAGDLGNGVQEGEIVKTLRLVIGLDDTHPDRLQFYPRMPYDWKKITVTKYPVLFENSGKMTTTFLHYKLKRSDEGMKLEISADEALGPVAMRLGPFNRQPEAEDILVNGTNPKGATMKQSGDSWWVSFTVPVGPNGGTTEQ